MDRRKLIVVAGVLVLVLLALGRRSRRDEVEIEIEGPADPEASASPEGGTVDLESLEGIGPAYADRLREAGVDDLSDLVTVDPAELARESGIAAGRIRTWIDRASERPDG